ncbi:DUF4393 domain-containing protein [Dickeya zeae]|uniref:DUF4393 domain-containing protein n=1 Tax=Dickeya zeae TaxID=204042 RepID=UPI00035FDB2B|nr:DUF4393 domain-containing protein [Dickeya zeae]UJR54985.1 DUF4393 domain-containing protein [Dickeya zeae MS1]
MSDENNNENVGNTVGNNKVAETINAATGLVKAIPVYQDLAQPAAQELGKSLHTVAQLVNVALAPVSACVWGYEKIKEFVDTKVAEKLKNINSEDIVSPAPNVAGPALEALKYTGYNETLSDMYASLLASSMNRNKVNNAHPSFVEIIKQLTPDEAKIISLFKKKESVILINLLVINKISGYVKPLVKNFSCFNFWECLDFPDLSFSYIDNLCRLGLLEIPEFTSLDKTEGYNYLQNHDFIKNKKKEIELKVNDEFLFENGMIMATSFGRQFISACVR